MDRKRKAVKIINTALGLIIILAVILASPLFGFGLGLTTAEQRRAAAEATPAVPYSRYSNTAATPRPTLAPTPTPVVLPSAPPTPDPTPEPTPRPAAARPAQTVTQPVQQTWLQEEVPEGEEEAQNEETDNTQEQPDYTGLGEQPVENSSGELLVETQNADIVIQTGDGGGGESAYIPDQQQETVPVTEPEPYVPISQDSNEGEAFSIE